MMGAAISASTGGAASTGADSTIPLKAEPARPYVPAYGPSATGDE
jgi:hypothetical protein